MQYCTDSGYNLLTENDIRAFCKKGLAIYKIPKKVTFIKEIPKNNVGKILRRKLRELQFQLNIIKWSIIGLIPITSFNE